jgi:hypothetical protein
MMAAFFKWWVRLEMLALSVHMSEEWRWATSHELELPLTMHWGWVEGSIILECIMGMVRIELPRWPMPKEIAHD